MARFGLFMLKLVAAVAVNMPQRSCCLGCSAETVSLVVREVNATLQDSENHIDSNSSVRTAAAAATASEGQVNMSGDVLMLFCLSRVR